MTHPPVYKLVPRRYSFLLSLLQDLFVHFGRPIIGSKPSLSSSSIHSNLVSLSFYYWILHLLEVQLQVHGLNESDLMLILMLLLVSASIKREELIRPK